MSDIAITKISATRNVVGAIRYLTEDKSHDGVHERVGSISVYNMSKRHMKEEMLETLKKFNKQNNVQAYMITQSFANDELDIDVQEDLDKANEVGLELAKRVAGEERQILVVTQADNGKVHNHILIASVNMRDGKSLRGNAKNHNHVANVSDEIIKKHRIKNKNRDRDAWRERKTIAEIKRREQGLYVWKDDLKRRIEEVMLTATNHKEMMRDLASRGVDVKINGNGNITYAFTDEEGKQRKCRASKLGNMYGKEGIEYGFTDNIRQAKRNIKVYRVDKTEQRDTRCVDSVSREQQSADTINSSIRETNRQIRERQEREERERIERNNRRLERIDEITRKQQSSQRSERGIDY